MTCKYPECNNNRWVKDYGKCKVTDCDRDSYVKGWCGTHYNYLIKHGEERAISHKIGEGRFKETDYLNKDYGSLTIIKFTKARYVSTGQIMRRCLCECKCGVVKEYFLNNIKVGFTKSCGCIGNGGGNTKHNLSKHPLYSTWYSMIDRCYNPEYKFFHSYGGRGITVYDKWHDVEIFIKDIVDLIGLKPNKDYSIDRIDNDRGYYPDNIRWATQKQQRNNTRITGKLTMGNLAKLTGYSRERIRQLTHRTTSSPYTHIFPLNDYIMCKIGNSHIYSPDAINYLIDRRQ